jgi:endo-alpha-1,4-polygalactosaminidase (GH114 family)
MIEHIKEAAFRKYPVQKSEIFPDIDDVYYPERMRFIKNVESAFNDEQLMKSYEDSKWIPVEVVPESGYYIGKGNPNVKESYHVKYFMEKWTTVIFDNRLECKPTHYQKLPE